MYQRDDDGHERAELRKQRPCRFVREGDGWKLVYLHGSYPVPDEVAVEHPEWWDDALSSRA